VRYDAVVLAGGTARRLGGVDKAALDVRGRSLLSHALAAVAGAGTVVVVGDQTPTDRAVVFAREQPAYGGPVAAAYAGRDALGAAADLVVVLAVDMPGVTVETVDRLLAACGRDRGAALTSGGRTHLALAVPVRQLDAARPPVTDGVALRDLLPGLALNEVPAQGDEAADVDTPDDLSRWLGENGERA
jgi:molybdopterin-guanine dinucleotide biosynthesis protein A